MCRTILVSLLLALLAACGHPTFYQPATDGYGFVEQRLEANRYRVTFRGNSITPLPVVENYLLYRAAEITLQNGFDYFAIADKKTDKSTRYFATYDDFGRPYPFRRFPYRYYDSGFYTANYRPIEEFTTTANVLLFRGRKPADRADAYDARDVVQRLGPTILRPAAGTP